MMPRKKQSAKARKKEWEKSDTEQESYESEPEFDDDEEPEGDWASYAIQGKIAKMGWSAPSIPCFPSTRASQNWYLDKHILLPDYPWEISSSLLLVNVIIGE